MSVYKNPYICCQMSFLLSEYTKIDVGWGFAPDPSGELTPPDPLTGFKGAASWQEGMEGRGRKD